MSPKKISSNLNIYLMFFTSLFVLISTQQVSQKNVFDETNLKHLKLKNRFSVEQ